MSLHDAIRESCDVYFFRGGAAPRHRCHGRYGAHVSGSAKSTTAACRSREPGLVADPDWKRGRWNAGWLAGETVLAGIGQGYMLASPLQLAVMMARVATGRAVEPTLVKRCSDGVPLTISLNWGLKTKAGAVRRGLAAVVNEEGGTGKNAFLGAGRPLVAGKTGTSQVNSASGRHRSGRPRLG